ncbi:hypothetical protein [Streptomyces sp. CC210A]|uniref:hypothetical protein n=1 Tax=Streptomyces sp. CC210A TaxID=2898184 RepID=UPI001F47A1DD|nr:hypothetical protein [Streptomyces sp. CC210A]
MPAMPKSKTATRAVHCPSCRATRTARQIHTATIHGRRHLLVECTDKTCELIWAIRPNTAALAA